MRCVCQFHSPVSGFWSCWTMALCLICLCSVFVACVFDSSMAKQPLHECKQKKRTDENKMCWISSTALPKKKFVQQAADWKANPSSRKTSGGMHKTKCKGHRVLDLDRPGKKKKKMKTHQNKVRVHVLDSLQPTSSENRPEPALRLLDWLTCSQQSQSVCSLIFCCRGSWEVGERSCSKLYSPSPEWGERTGKCLGQEKWGCVFFSVFCASR